MSFNFLFHLLPLSPSLLSPLLISFLLFLVISSVLLCDLTLTLILLVEGVALYLVKRNQSKRKSSGECCSKRESGKI